MVSPRSNTPIIECIRRQILCINIDNKPWSPYVSDHTPISHHNFVFQKIVFAWKQIKHRREEGKKKTYTPRHKSGDVCLNTHHHSVLFPTIGLIHLFVFVYPSGFFFKLCDFQSPRLKFFFPMHLSKKKKPLEFTPPPMSTN